MDTEPRRCGRPKKSGGFCANTIYGPAVYACRVHETEHDRELAKAYKDGFARGRESGKEWGRREATIEHNQALREQEKSANLRLTEGGHQIVEVKGRYAYVWTGDTPLAIGDVVTLPGNSFRPYPWDGAVTGFGTSYTGSLSKILHRQPQPEQ